MKRKVMWLAVALLLFDIAFVGTARATRRAGIRRRLATAEPAPLRVQQYYPLMTVTVVTPMQLPDHLLMPGQYTFEMKHGCNNVSITSADGKLLGTYIIVPAYRRDASGGLVTIQDAPGGGPDRIADWFFPDQQDGYSFLYPSL